MNKTLLIILVVIIVVIIGGMAYFIIFNKNFKNSNTNTITNASINNNETEKNINISVNRVTYSSSSPIFGKFEGYNFRGQTKPLLDITLYTDNLEFYDFVKEVLSDFPSYTRLIFKPFPLVQFHPGSQNFTEALECADDQDKFWLFVDTLYQDKGLNKIIEAAAQSDETFISQLSSVLAETNINSQQFSDCILKEKFKQQVASMVEKEMKNGITGAPTSIVNGKTVQGANEGVLRKTVNDELKSSILSNWKKYTISKFQLSFLYPDDYEVSESSEEDGKVQKIILIEPSSGKTMVLYSLREWPEGRYNNLKEKYTKSSVGTYQVGGQFLFKQIFTDKNTGKKSYVITISFTKDQIKEGVHVIEDLGTIEIWSDIDTGMSEAANLIAASAQHEE